MTTTSPYCESPHPDSYEQKTRQLTNGRLETLNVPTIWCRRIKNHDGDHSAYILGPKHPMTWPQNNGTPIAAIHNLDNDDDEIPF